MPVGFSQFNAHSPYLRNQASTPRFQGTGKSYIPPQPPTLPPTISEFQRWEDHETPQAIQTALATAFNIRPAKIAVYTASDNYGLGLDGGYLAEQGKLSIRDLLAKEGYGLTWEFSAANTEVRPKPGEPESIEGKLAQTAAEFYQTIKNGTTPYSAPHGIDSVVVVRENVRDMSDRYHVFMKAGGSFKTYA